MSDQPKTVRVEIELEDGTVRRLTGEAAQKWSERVASEGMLSMVHGYSFEALPWQEFKKPLTEPAP